MQFRTFPPLPPPPAADTADDIPKSAATIDDLRDHLNQRLGATNSFMSSITGWLETLVVSMNQREAQLDRFANGGVYQGRPFSRDRNFGSNLNEAYRHFFIYVPKTVPKASTQAICFNPRFPDDGPPRGWSVVQAQALSVTGTGDGPVLLDQILSSHDPEPTGNPGYHFCKVIDDHTIQGDQGGLVAGWTLNDVRVGDEITCLWADAAPPGTISVTAGSHKVIGMGTLFKSIPLGCYINLQTALLEGLKQVILIESDTVMYVNDIFEATVAGAGYDLTYTDQGWKRIKEIQPQVAAEDILVLDPDVPDNGTLVPAGTTQVDYVIRRPPQPGQIWIRVFAERDMYVCVTLRIW